MFFRSTSLPTTSPTVQIRVGQATPPSPPPTEGGGLKSFLDFSLLMDCISPSATHYGRYGREGFAICLRKIGLDCRGVVSIVWDSAERKRCHPPWRPTLLLITQPSLPVSIPGALSRSCLQDPLLVPILFSNQSLADSNGTACATARLSNVFACSIHVLHPNTSLAVLTSCVFLDIRHRSHSNLQISHIHSCGIDPGERYQCCQSATSPISPHFAHCS